MSTQYQPEDEIVNNERSLRQLAWALEASVGQFKLILARCNYSDLRLRLIERLREICQIQIQVLQLKESERTLYSAIREQIGDDVQALMIVGWESLRNLPQMFINANQVREEFRKNLSLPIVLWINDEIHSSIMQIAPDLESWATTKSFAIASNDLTQFIQQLADQYFSGNFIFSVDRYSTLETELEAAQKDLPANLKEVEANLASLLGLVKQTNNKIDIALEYYQKARVLWQQLGHLEKQGKILAEIAYCYYLKACKNQDNSYFDWQATRQYTQEYIYFLTRFGNLDLIASSIVKFGNILRDLQEWEQLENLAMQALKVHQSNNQPRELAKDYGFLAEVALAQKRWSEAKHLAQKAQEVLVSLQSADLTDISELLPQEIVILDDLSLYKFILAQSQYQLGSPQEAIQNLEAARNVGSPLENLQLHLNILSYLQRLYFERKEYLKAYETKQQQRSIEQQFGLRAFVGAGRLQSTKQTQLIPSKTGIQENIAPEIAASGRLFDIERLVERLGRHDHKLIVIHGHSGVGKTSLVNAGLVPALKNKNIGIQDYLPITMRVYTNWIEELGKLIQKALQEKGRVRNEESLELEDSTSEIPTSADFSSLIYQLQENEQHNLRTVLIFDQFEEFFFVYTQPKQRQQFFEFLGECLNILSLKVLLSLRVDYLHYLLECNRLPSMTIIGKDILSSNVLYELGNFSPTDAKSIIQRLTETTSFHLEPALIDQLVKDLAAEIGEVRPIELQVVGAQLQTENITTLAEYQQSGTKEELAKRYLAEVVNDCGAENQQLAELLLYFLTDEQGTRPLKTRVELERDLQQYILLIKVFLSNNLPTIFKKRNYTKLFASFKDRFLKNKVLKINNNQVFNANNLDLILEIFIKSGLVVLLPENPADRYQLVHDYLALFIRQQQEPRLKLLITQLEEERKLRRLSETRLNRALRIALAASLIAILGLSVSIVTALDSEIKTLSVSSEVLFTSQKGIDALKEGLKAGRKLQQAVWVDASTREQVQTALYQAVFGAREYNRLEGHLYGVNSATFSPDRSLIASASADSTIKLWYPDGSEFRTLSGHEDVVNSVSFSPDGQIIASASQDNTVKLWSWKDQLLATLLGHKAVVNSVSFSPDSQIIASGSTDKTIKLWSPDGKLLKTLEGHNGAVLSVVWSADGQTIASGSADNTIKLWSPDGKLLKTWQGHDDAIKSIAWLPDGQIIATASLDNTIKLWNPQGKLLTKLSSHTAAVTGVAWSPDGHTIASASIDETIKLWSTDGVLLGTLKGHNNWVNSVNFSSDGRTLISASRDKTIKLWRWDDVLLRNPKNDNNDWITSISFSPDGRTLAAASQDNTVKILTRYGKLLRTFIGHKKQVWGVSYSPDGREIASASKDKTVKLWSSDGKLLHTLQGHNDTVLGVAWAADGQTVASASKDATVRLWSRNGQLLHTLRGHQDAVNWVSFNNDSKLVASASDDNTVKIWDINSKLIYSLKGHKRRVNGVAWSPDGQTLASVSIDSTVKIWSRDGRLLKTLKGDGDSFIGVSFSPDGKTLAASSDDKIRLWNQQGTLLIVLKGDNEELTSVSFSPDGQMLAAGSGNGTVIFRYLADLKLENLLTRGCTWLQDYLQTNRRVTESDRALCAGR
ncbi:WD-40 repeat protein [Nostoc sp. NIES-4103]|nr:WD-40 repeat protein [Nostoc sp. NIES-4103]